MKVLLITPHRQLLFEDSSHSMQLFFQIAFAIQSEWFCLKLVRKHYLDS